MNGRCYEDLHDMNTHIPYVDEHTPPHTMESFSSLSFDRVRLIVTEKSVGLKIHFEIEDNMNLMGKKTKLLPRLAIENFCKVRGRIPCVHYDMGSAAQTGGQTIHPGQQLFRFTECDVQEIEAVPCSNGLPWELLTKRIHKSF
jgi:hypothetical protein